jgi:hypothetical protein
MEDARRQTQRRLEIINRRIIRKMTAMPADDNIDDPGRQGLNAAGGRG